MKERPILFSAPMVRAILDGWKKQTRRVAIKTSQPDNVYPVDFDATEAKIEIENKHAGARYWKQCPYGQPGDHLWVREAWQGPLLESDEQVDEFRQSPDIYKKPGFCAYRATDTLDAIDEEGKELGWRPSIHMPRWASRINLEITGVRVERLQDISRGDAMGEGCPFPNMAQGDDPRQWYASLWETINGPGSWAANPWVWVIEFNRVHPEAGP